MTRLPHWGLLIGLLSSAVMIVAAGWVLLDNARPLALRLWLSLAGQPGTGAVVERSTLTTPDGNGSETVRYVLVVAYRPGAALTPIEVPVVVAQDLYSDLRGADDVPLRYDPARPTWVLLEVQFAPPRWLGAGLTATLGLLAAAVLGGLGGLVGAAVWPQIRAEMTRGKS